jgi:iron complex outermembrane receptor protein
MLVLVCLAASTAYGQETGAIAGRVLSEAGAFPVSRARVLIVDTTRGTLTNADGSFSIDQIPLGERTVVIVRDGYAPLSQKVTVSAGETLTLEIRLPAAPTIVQEVTVTGRLSDYVDSNARASRTSAALIDVPQAIAVLPAPLIEDIGALDTKDLYKHISGVSDSPYSPPSSAALHNAKCWSTASAETRTGASRAASLTTSPRNRASSSTRT